MRPALFTPSIAEANAREATSAVPPIVMGFRRLVCDLPHLVQRVLLEDDRPIVSPIHPLAPPMPGYDRGDVLYRETCQSFVGGLRDSRRLRVHPCEQARQTHDVNALIHVTGTRQGNQFGVGAAVTSTAGMALPTLPKYVSGQPFAR